MRRYRKEHGVQAAANPTRPEFWAAQEPDRLAIVDGDEEVTYGEWSQRSNQLADGLLRLAPEASRVVVITHTRVEWFLTNLALAKLGWDHVAVNWKVTIAEYCAAVRSCGGQVIVTDHPDPGAIAAGLTDLPVRVVSIGAKGEGVLAFESLCSPTESWPPGYRPTQWISQSPAPFVKYTSGTTGTPKAIRRATPLTEEERRVREQTSHGRIDEIRAARGGGPRPHRALVTMPLHHGAGPRGARLAHRDGGTCYLLDQFDPVEALRIIQTHRITHWSAVPTMLERIRRLPADVVDAYDVSSVRMIGIGAAPASMVLKRWVLTRFGECLYEGYGASEVGMVTLMEPAMHLVKPGSCGRPRPNVSIRVVNATGEVLPPNVDGEIEVRTPITMSSYLGEAADDRIITQDGYFHTGDVGHVDEDGYLFITGRSKDLIIRGGVNVSPAYIEQVIAEHPGVADVAVVGVPDEEFGEQVAAYCEPMPGVSVTERELLEFSTPRLASYLRPRLIVVLDELPRNVMGKVLKAELRALAAAERLTDGGVRGG
jgi:long-chain acyl-CoA synthetase